MRKFLRNMTVEFDGKRAFQQAVDYWRKSVNTLRKNAQILASRLKSLMVTRAIRREQDVVMLGKIEGREFAMMIRTARSVEAFETATGSRLSVIARQAFRRVDDVAKMHFSNLALFRQKKYLINQRNDLISRN